MKESPVYGYKCFNKGLTNRYGEKFEIGKMYQCNKEIKFGNDGHGFHICKRLEDTLRYFDAMNEDVDICEVKCSGKIEENEDDYNGYYDMYACECLEIIRLLTREEIITYGLNLTDDAAKRFVSLFKLNDQEISLFKEKYKNNPNILSYIGYYQEKDLEAFNKKYRRR